MESKNKIGALVILGGIAILGFVYFKKNKPVVSTIQAKGLEELSNFYKSGGIKDDTQINVNYVVQPINPFGSSLGSSVFLDPSFAKELQNAENIRKENMELYGTPYNPNKPIDKSNSMFPELENLGKITLSDEAISNLTNMQTGLDKIDWSKIKF